MVLCLLDLSYFLKSWVAVSASEDAVTSFSLYWQPSEMKCLRSALRGILRLSQNVSMDMPVPYFLFPVRGEFLRLYASPNSIKSGWVLSLMFAFPRVVEGSSSVYAFSQSCWVEPAFCPCWMSTKVAHTALRGTHKVGQCLSVECSMLEAQGYGYGPIWGIHSGCPQWLTRRLPDGVCKVVSGTVPLLNSEPWLLCSQPLLALQICRSPLYSERGEKEVGVLNSFTQSCGSWALTHMFSLSSAGEITGQACLSWHWAVEDEVTGDVGIFLLPFSMCPISVLYFFLCFNDIVLTPPLDSWVPERCSHLCAIIKISILWVEEGNSTELMLQHFYVILLGISCSLTKVWQNFPVKFLAR